MERLLVFLSKCSITLLTQELFVFERSIARVNDHPGLEIQDSLQIPKRHIEQMTNPARESLEEPNMGDRTGKLDMRQPFPPDLRLGNFHTALVTDDSAVLHALVFATQTLPISDGAEDLCAEKTVPFRLEGPIVDRFRFGHFTMGPSTDLLRRSQADLDGVEIDD
jgi:hypothetical protein